MTSLDPKTREQLCAWMDGELPAEEALFLERRLAHDTELRAQWERWQLASACMRGQAPAPMRADFSERVLAAVSLPEQAASKRRPVWGWAIAASFAALAVTVALQMRPENPASAPAVASAHATPMTTAPITASPASADMVAANIAAAPSPEPIVAEAVVKPAAAVRAPAVNRSTATVALRSPSPTDSQSPTQFPLSQSTEAKGWPRSPVAVGNDASMEAYLVRHNEMVSDGGLGGFVPYVDVVTRERDGADAQSGEDDGQ